MAILAIFKGPSITKAHYEALRKEVQWEKAHPEGVIVHVAGFDDAGGLHVADVWESAAAMNQFVEGRLLPAMKKLKIAPPEVQVLPAHNVNAYPAIDPFKLKKGK